MVHSFTHWIQYPLTYSKVSNHDLYIFYMSSISHLLIQYLYILDTKYFFQFSFLWWPQCKAHWEWLLYLHLRQVLFVFLQDFQTYQLELNFRCCVHVLRDPPYHINPKFISIRHYLAPHMLHWYLNTYQQLLHLLDFYLGGISCLIFYRLFW